MIGHSLGPFNQPEIPNCRFWFSALSLSVCYSLSCFSFFPALSKTDNVVSNPQRQMYFPSACNYGRGKRSYIRCNKCNGKYNRGVVKSASFSGKWSNIVKSVQSPKLVDDHGPYLRKINVYLKYIFSFLAREVYTFVGIVKTWHSIPN